MEEKCKEKVCNTGKTQGILSGLECGHPENLLIVVLIFSLVVNSD